MEANADIGRGFHKGNKEAHSRFLGNAATDLNELGPPSLLLNGKRFVGNIKN